MKDKDEHVMAAVFNPERDEDDAIPDIDIRVAIVSPMLSSHRRRIRPLLRLPYRSMMMLLLLPLSPMLVEGAFIGRL